MFVRDVQINIEKNLQIFIFGKTAKNKLKCCADYRSTKTVYTVDYMFVIFFGDDGVYSVSESVDDACFLFNVVM